MWSAIRVRLGIACATAAVLLAGCGSPAPDPSQAAAPEPQVNLAATLYSCGFFPFEASVWDRVGNAEMAPNPAAAALRTQLAKRSEDDINLPDHGWTLIGLDDSRAEFLAPDTEDTMFQATLSQAGGRWRVDGWGECSPQRALPPGMNNASWVLAPDQQVGPDTTSLTALVTETECASGESSEGRVVGPEIVQLPDRVLVTFAVHALSGGAHRCPGNPVTMVKIRLPVPLGPRRLLDGSSLPARDPVKVECCG
jgi:hypothetical protein